MLEVDAFFFVLLLVECLGKKKKESSRYQPPTWRTDYRSRDQKHSIVYILYLGAHSFPWLATFRRRLQFWGGAYNRSFAWDVKKGVLSVLSVYPSIHPFSPVYRATMYENNFIHRWTKTNENIQKIWGNYVNAFLSFNPCFENVGGCPSTRRKASQEHEDSIMMDDLSWDSNPEPDNLEAAVVNTRSPRCPVHQSLTYCWRANLWYTAHLDCGGVPNVVAREYSFQAGQLQILKKICVIFFFSVI